MATGAAVLLVGGVVAASAGAVTIPATPIPGGPESSESPQFIGKVAVPRRVAMDRVPQHPFMAPNGRSNIHNDAYQSDVYRQVGPLGKSMSVISTENVHECASITFDTAGRLVAVCPGLEGPILTMMDPRTLDLLAAMPLPPRTSAGPDILTDFSAGGYFYLDNLDRVVTATTTRHIFVIAQAETPAGPGFELQEDYDLTSAVPVGDSIISALPDWRGRIWFASKKGVVGNVKPGTGAIQSLDLQEPIGNSFAVDETNGVFIVSDAAQYRFQAGQGNEPRVIWRRGYRNIGIKKPGQTQIGSGTTPTLMGERFLSITDNDDPMNVLVLRRGRDPKQRRLVCKAPVFQKGASSTDQSLIATETSMIAENNYGYTGIGATQNGGTTTPGLERVDMVPLGGDRYRCKRIWRSNEIAPSAVPKLSLGAGLVYTWTKPAGGDDPWYFTAIDFRTGKTVFKQLAGSGLGHNNHYSPITLGPRRNAYTGTFGGVVSLRDTP